MTDCKPLPRTYIPAEVIIERMKDGEPLRWVKLETLGRAPEPGCPQVLMIGGDRLDECSYWEIDDSPRLQENPVDSDGITTFELIGD